MVHEPKHGTKNHFSKAVMSILFSQADYNIKLNEAQKSIVDEFFESL
jgi:hypothetical protein